MNSAINYVLYLLLVIHFRLFFFIVLTYNSTLYKWLLIQIKQLLLLLYNV